MSVDCKALDKEQEDAKWAARKASSEEFARMDSMKTEADGIRTASGKTGMTNEDIIEGQVDLLETAKEGKADQVKALMDDYSDAHAAGAGNGKTSAMIDQLNKEIAEYERVEARLNGLVDAYAQAEAKHNRLEDDYEKLLDAWDEHCAPDAGK
jgi:hypothetical protein